MMYKCFSKCSMTYANRVKRLELATVNARRLEVLAIPVCFHDYMTSFPVSVGFVLSKKLL